MDFFNLFCNGLFFSADCIFYEPITFPHSPDCVIPLHLTYGSGEFQTNFFVWNVDLLRFLIIGQISQMNQQSQDVIRNVEAQIAENERRRRLRNEERRKRNMERRNRRPYDRNSRGPRPNGAPVRANAEAKPAETKTEA